jgi:hypothetical protein
MDLFCHQAFSLNSNARCRSFAQAQWPKRADAGAKTTSTVCYTAAQP